MSEINNQEQPIQEPKELTGIDLWNVEFQALMQEARKRELFAPDVLFFLARACNEIQHQMNSILFTHEHKTRDEHEQAILRTLEIYKPEYLVLAKYMRILSPEFVSHYPNKIVNIHHSFLPAFIGANPYRQAYERGVKIIGATAHFVNNNLDEGPIIAQNVKDVDHSYMATDMAREGKEVEKSVLTHALKLVFNDRVFISGNRTVIL